MFYSRHNPIKFCLTFGVHIRGQLPWQRGVTWIAFSAKRGFESLPHRSAVRVVKSAPQKWEPGEKTKGVPVDVTYTMLVVFTLPDKE